MNSLQNLRSLIKIMQSMSLDILIGKSLMHIEELTADIPRLKEYVDEDQAIWDEIYNKILELKNHSPDEIVQIINEFEKTYQEYDNEIFKNDLKNDRLLEMNNNLLEIFNNLNNTIDKYL